MSLYLDIHQASDYKEDIRGVVIAPLHAEVHPGSSIYSLPSVTLMSAALQVPAGRARAR